MMVAEEQLLPLLDSNDQMLGEDIPRRAVIVEDGPITLVKFPTPVSQILLSRVSVVLLAALGSWFAYHTEALLTVRGLLPLLVIGVGLYLAVLAAGEEIVVSPQEVRLNYGVGPLRRTKTIPVVDIRQIAVRVFSFANWDAFVAIETDTRTFRIAWSASSETAHAIVEANKRRMPDAA